MTAAVEQFQPGVESKMEGKDQAARRTAGAIRRNAWMLALEQAWLLGPKDSVANSGKGEDLTQDQRPAAAQDVRHAVALPPASRFIEPAMHGVTNPCEREMDADADTSIHSLQQILSHALPSLLASPTLPLSTPAPVHPSNQSAIPGAVGCRLVISRVLPSSIHDRAGERESEPAAASGVGPLSVPPEGISDMSLPAMLSGHSGNAGTNMLSAENTHGKEGLNSKPHSPGILGEASSNGKMTHLDVAKMAVQDFSRFAAEFHQPVKLQGHGLPAPASCATSPVPPMASSSLNASGVPNLSIPAASRLPQRLPAPGIFVEAGPACFQDALQDSPESDVPVPPRSQSAISAAIARTEPLSPHRLHIYRDERGVQAWIRDAGLSASQEMAVSSALISAVSDAGESINAVYMNGKPITATLSTRKVRSDKDFDAHMAASDPQDSKLSTITQFSGVSFHGHQ